MYIVYARILGNMGRLKRIDTLKEAKAYRDKLAQEGLLPVIEGVSEPEEPTPTLSKEIESADRGWIAYELERRKRKKSGVYMLIDCFEQEYYIFPGKEEAVIYIGQTLLDENGKPFRTDKLMQYSLEKINKALDSNDMRLELVKYGVANQMLWGE